MKTQPVQQSRAAEFVRTRRQWLFAATGLLVLPCCKPKVTANPERTFTLYDVAWRNGQRDRLLPLPRDWHRYKEKLAPYASVTSRETIFAAGYNDGFDQHPDEPVSDTILDYDREFRRGRIDAWQGKAATSSTPGYSDGFAGRKHAHDRPY